MNEPRVYFKNEKFSCSWQDFYEANLEGVGDEELQGILAELTATGKCTRNYGAHGIMELEALPF